MLHGLCLENEFIAQGRAGSAIGERERIDETDEEQIEQFFTQNTQTLRQVRFDGVLSGSPLSRQGGDGLLKAGNSPIGARLVFSGIQAGGRIFLRLRQVATLDGPRADERFAECGG